MEIDLVLENILSHLPLCDVKYCRYVSRRWNALSIKYVIKSSICCLKSNGKLKEFNKHFPNPILFQPASIRLEGGFYVHALETFFRDRSFVRELTLEEVYLCDDKGIIQEYDLSTWAGLNLSVLHINNIWLMGLDLHVNRLATKFVLPLSYIGQIKILDLVGACTVMYDGRIAPTKMVATNIGAMMADGRTLDSNDILDLNQYINVTNLKEFIFIFLYFPTSIFRFDLTDCLRLQCLAYDKTLVIGWHKNLHLKRVYISDDVSTLDLSYLPDSIVELGVGGTTEIFNSQNGHLLNLKSLRLSQPFQFLAQCPNLTHLRIDHDLDLDTVPLSVSSITVATTCKFIGQRQVQLDKLVFFDFQCTADNWENIQKTINRLNPTIVVLGMNCYCDVDGYEIGGATDNLTEIVEMQMQKDGGTFVLKGQRCCNVTLIPDIPVLECGFGGSSPVPIEYHVFEKGTDRRISQADYQQWTGINQFNPGDLNLFMWY